MNKYDCLTPSTILTCNIYQLKRNHQNTSHGSNNPIHNQRPAANPDRSRRHSTRSRSLGRGCTRRATATPRRLGSDRARARGTSLANQGLTLRRLALGRLQRGRTGKVARGGSVILALVVPVKDIRQLVLGRADAVGAV